MERLNVVGDILNGHATIFINVLLDPLLLQAAEEEFGYGIILTVSFATHAGLQAMRFAEPPPRITAVLGSLV